MTTMRVRCPECKAEVRLEPRYGDEIVSVYCLKHVDKTDGRTRPVYMTIVPEDAFAALLEPRVGLVEAAGRR